MMISPEPIEPGTNEPETNEPETNELADHELPENLAKTELGTPDRGPSPELASGGAGFWPKDWREAWRISWRSWLGQLPGLPTPGLPTPSLPTNLARAARQWFALDEDQLRQILSQVRDRLPTTEAILLGKPQAGKSSIVRGLTGVSAEIVGQGFRPHTNHTTRYAYPSEELPLLLFTDTVGLGEAGSPGQGESDDLLQELLTAWGKVARQEVPQSDSANRPDPAGQTIDSEIDPGIDPETDRQTDRQVDRPIAQPTEPNPDPASSLSDPAGAKILIVVVKITDFAIDRLSQVLRGLRSQRPDIPCLLVVTCLHEVYPLDQTDHPPYPPEGPEVQRPYAALQAALAGLFDRVVPIDFTLAEDGYEPMFYGLAALRDAIADLLPEAEARAIHQLLDREAGAGSAVTSLYRDRTRRYILAFATVAAAIAAVPIPFATMPVLTAVQTSMVVALGQVYGQRLSVAQAGGLVTAIAGGFLAQAIGRELVKVIPGLGSAIAASWSFGYTWALGEGASLYFGDLVGGKTPQPDRIQAAMAEAFQTAQTHFRQER